MEIQEKTGAFPTFSAIVEFVTKEAKIAYNPVTSLHALKVSEGHTTRPSKTRSIGAKVLASSTGEKADVTKCVFCEKLGHDLHVCRKFMEKVVAERVKFIQTKRLCFGCLKTGHHSKACESRSVCETCKRKHPTCLHKDRVKERKEVQSKDSNE